MARNIVIRRRIRGRRKSNHDVKLSKPMLFRARYILKKPVAEIANDLGVTVLTAYKYMSMFGLTRMDRNDPEYVRLMHLYKSSKTIS